MKNYLKSLLSTICLVTLIQSAPSLDSVWTKGFYEEDSLGYSFSDGDTVTGGDLIIAGMVYRQSEYTSPRTPFFARVDSQGIEIWRDTVETWGFKTSLTSFYKDSDTTFIAGYSATDSTVNILRYHINGTLQWNTEQKLNYNKRFNVKKPGDVRFQVYPNDITVDYSENYVIVCGNPSKSYVAIIKVDSAGNSGIVTELEEGPGKGYSVFIPENDSTYNSQSLDSEMYKIGYIVTGGGYTLTFSEYAQLLHARDYIVTSTSYPRLADSSYLVIDYRENIIDLRDIEESRIARYDADELLGSSGSIGAVIPSSDTSFYALLNINRYDSNYNVEQSGPFIFKFKYMEHPVSILNQTVQSNELQINVIGTTLHLNNFAQYSLNIYSANGRLLRNITETNNTIFLDKLNLASGIYQMSITQGADVFNGQFILK